MYIKDGTQTMKALKLYLNFPKRYVAPNESFKMMMLNMRSAPLYRSFQKYYLGISIVGKHQLPNITNHTVPPWGAGKLQISLGFWGGL